MVNCWGYYLFIITNIAYFMQIYIEFLLQISNHNLNYFFHIEFLSFCLHIKGLHDICTAIFPQSSARAVLGCARLCSQASINPSSCFPAAKIPHILLYKEAFCLPFVIPSSHHLTYWALVNNYSSTYSQLGILSYIFLSFLYQKSIYKSTSLIFTYKRKQR